MLARARSVALIGVDAVPIEVEVDVSPGLPAFTVVGLPDQAVSEARERVRAALRNAGLPFPAARITVNLAPADLRKEGPLYDLPIALGLLAAQELLPHEALHGTVTAGELALDGSLRPIAGAVNVALLAAGLKLPALLPAGRPSGDSRTTWSATCLTRPPRSPARPCSRARATTERAGSTYSTGAWAESATASWRSAIRASSQLLAAATRTRSWPAQRPASDGAVTRPTPRGPAGCCGPGSAVGEARRGSGPAATASPTCPPRGRASRSPSGS